MKIGDTVYHKTWKIYGKIEKVRDATYKYLVLWDGGQRVTWCQESEIVVKGKP